MATRGSEVIRQDMELAEWLDSMQSLLQADGSDRAKQVFRALRDFLTDENVIVGEATLNTPYRNTTPGYRFFVCILIEFLQRNYLHAAA
jgi:pyruvate dehydrogenase complex dehydrogenase (E1) component